MASTLRCKVRSRKSGFGPASRFPGARTPPGRHRAAPRRAASGSRRHPASMKVSVITLGCDKNTVDSERYVAQLADHGATYTPELDDADVILVNTCGFIDAAKKESIDALVAAGRLKERG